VSAGDAADIPIAEDPPGGASTGSGPGGAMTEEQLRAAYEEELRRMTSSDLMLQAAVSLINLAGSRLGSPAAGAGEGSRAGAEPRDLEQVRDAIDGVRALLGVLERRRSKELGPLRDALSQLQLAYAREAQAGAGARESAPGAPPQPGSDRSQEGDQKGSAGDGEQSRGPGPAEASGRLWVPGR
jgi:hypothetical protein